MKIEDYYRKLAPKLTNWLVASGSQYHEACDIVQSTFLKLWSMRDDVRDDEAAVSGLVFTIARNLRKNLARDAHRLTFTDEIRDEDAGAVKPSESASDVEYLRNRLNKAFAMLPPVLREAYTLYQVGEMSVREVANQLGITENLVKVRVYRAKEKLRGILADLRVTF